MTDAREALMALIPPLRASEHVAHWRDYYRHGDFADWSERLEVLDRMRREKVADAILAAGWTPPGERAQCDHERAAREMAHVTPLTAEDSLRMIEAARALFRTEVEVKAEALRDAADEIPGSASHDPIDPYDRVAEWLIDRADTIEKEADRG